MDDVYSEYAPIFKALSDETRLKIVDMLSCGEMCACDILTEFNISQPTLSYHMKILSDSGLVLSKRDGAWMKYSINQEKSNTVIDFLSRLIKEKDGCICKKYQWNSK